MATDTSQRIYSNNKVISHMYVNMCWCAYIILQAILHPSVYVNMLHSKLNNMCSWNCTCIGVAINSGPGVTVICVPPGNVCPQTHFPSDICSPTRYHWGQEFPLAKTSVICVSVFKNLTCMILTVTEGFIVGLFFIQAPQEWMKANTEAFLNYTMFDMKKDNIGISFCSSSIHYFLEPSSSWSTW